MWQVPHTCRGMLCCLLVSRGLHGLLAFGELLLSPGSPVLLVCTLSSVFGNELICQGSLSPVILPFKAMASNRKYPAPVFQFIQPKRKLLGLHPRWPVPPVSRGFSGMEDGHGFSGTQQDVWPRVVCLDFYFISVFKKSICNSHRASKMGCSLLWFSRSLLSGSV